MVQVNFCLWWRESGASRLKGLLKEKLLFSSFDLVNFGVGHLLCFFQVKCTIFWLNRFEGTFGFVCAVFSQKVHQSIFYTIVQTPYFGFVCLRNYPNHVIPISAKKRKKKFQRYIEHMR